MKLRGIADSKRRLEAHRRNIERRAPAEHVPEVCADGAIRCSCAGGSQRFSPQAFFAHLAGRAMVDGYRGTFTIGREDHWAREQERNGAHAQPEEPQPAERPGAAYVDSDGNAWRPGVNEFQQRTLTCVAGPRIGHVELDTRLVAVPPEREARAVGGYVDEPF